MRLRFDKGPWAGPAVFDGAERMFVADEPDQVPDALAGIDAARRDGFWIAGFASYELGYALEPRLAALLPAERDVPLLKFGVYHSPNDSPPALPVPRSVSLRNFAPRWDQRTYSDALGRLRVFIGAGDIYQANLTFPIDADAAGADPAALYAALLERQQVGHGVLIEDGTTSHLCRSPELFFRNDRNGNITTRPMKGTRPRDPDPERDSALRDSLARSEKDLAENLMIVDLLRNDISRIARPGTVRVPHLFAIETYATVHQMVSEISAEMRPGTGLSDIFAALFPCGSITGAPKIRAMEIIRELEPWPRGIYCGSIGWAAPDGSADFNVAIRTVTLRESRAVMNVGGGIVWDSTPDGEYEEALWKARFAGFRPELD